MADNSYFGIKLGEALSAGAGHISDAIRRKYEMRRQDEIRNSGLQREQQRQDQSLKLGFAGKGINYDPNNPAASFQALQQSAAKDIEAGRARTAAETKLLDKKSSMGDNAGKFGVERLKVGGIEREIPVRYTENGPIPISMGAQSTQKPLTQAQSNASQGLVATDKMLSMLDAAKGKPIGRIGGLGGSLPQTSMLGKALRLGDEQAQEFVAARDEAVDLIARIRTGAVITSNEEKIYANKLYSILNKDGVNKKTIRMIRDYFQRMIPKGYNPNTMSYEEPVPMGGAGNAESNFDPVAFLEELEGK